MENLSNSSVPTIHSVTNGSRKSEGIADFQRLMGLLILIGLLALCTGCGTLLNGPTQRFSVWPDPTDAALTVNGYPVAPGESLLISRDFPVEVHGERDGYCPRTVVLDPTYSRFVAFNLIFAYGMPLGILIDHISGGAYEIEPEALLLRLEPLEGTVPDVTAKPPPFAEEPPPPPTSLAERPAPPPPPPIARPATRPRPLPQRPQPPPPRTRRIEPPPPIRPATRFDYLQLRLGAFGGYELNPDGDEDYERRSCETGRAVTLQYFHYLGQSRFGLGTEFGWSRAIIEDRKSGLDIEERYNLWRAALLLGMHLGHRDDTHLRVSGLLMGMRLDSDVDLDWNACPGAECRDERIVATRYRVGYGALLEVFIHLADGWYLVPSWRASGTRSGSDYLYANEIDLGVSYAF